jgi:GLPGLI family protein
MQKKYTVMKIFINTLLFLLLSATAFSQQVLEIKFLQKANPRVNEQNGEFFSNDDYAILVTDGLKSTYRYGQGGSGKEVKRGENNTVKITYSDAYGFIFHRDASKGVLVSRDLIKDQPFIIREDAPQIDWQIDEKQVREIGGYQCKLAVGEFRGRVYEAWFAPEIPINAGPWKLAGLPGLILEARDRKGIIQFVFAGLRQVPAEEAEWNTAPRRGITTNFKNFFDTRARKDEEFFKKIASYPGVTIKPAEHKGYFEIAL